MLQWQRQCECRTKEEVKIQGFLAKGLVDSGSDITIINGVLFQQVAKHAKLRKHNFKPADKVPCTYNRE